MSEQPVGFGDVADIDRPLWSMLDWSFWGHGVGDELREHVAAVMVNAVPRETRDQLLALFVAWKNHRGGLPSQPYEELRRENKRLRDELGSARDWEAWENAQAEIRKLRAELDAMNTAIGFETTCLGCAATLNGAYEQTVRAETAEAELERAQPVLDAARAFLAAKQSGERYDLAEHIGAILNTAEDYAAGPGGCAGHTRKPSEAGEPHEFTPYPDNDDRCQVCFGSKDWHWILDRARHTKAVAEARRRCPEALVFPDETMVVRCVRDAHPDDLHWNRDREMEWGEAAAEGLSSADTTAVEA